MKTFVSCLALLIACCSCSRIEINDDSIIGIWENTVKTVSTTGKTSLDIEEWTFNDVYLGRYHGFDFKGEIVFITDFEWAVEGDVYTISYPGTSIPESQVKMVVNESGTQLIKISGDTFAYKRN